MYSFLYTNKNVINGKDDYLLHIMFNDEVIQSTFVQFNQGTSQEALNNFANNMIDSIEGNE